LKLSEDLYFSAEVSELLQLPPSYLVLVFY